jgi:RHS repeat-associated protein
MRRSSRSPAISEAATAGSSCTSGATYTQFVYDPLGEKLGLMNGQTVSRLRVPLPGGGSAIYGAGGALLRYWHADGLGNIRLYSNPNPPSFYGDTAFAPFGEAYAGSTTPCGIFAGLPADTVYNGSVLGDALFREFDTLQSRWLSPDPAGLAAVDDTNPQSLNRYSYVLGNPTTLIDPSGLGPACLFRSGGLGHAMVSTGGAGCNGVYDGGDGGASIDGGGGIPAGLGGLLGGAGPGGGLESAVPCPGNACTIAGVDPLTGQPAILEFMTGAGGATGYLSGYDIGQGLNEVGGTFLSNTQYLSYLQATYAGDITVQRQTLAQAIAANSGGQIGYQEALGDLSTTCVYVQGGNCNFSFGTLDTTLLCGGDPRCNGIHFTDQGTVHLDTSNPWSGPWGLLEHAFVDVFLGNVAYYIIPRPWP